MRVECDQQATGFNIVQYPETLRVVITCSYNYDLYRIWESWTSYNNWLGGRGGGGEFLNSLRC